MVVEGLVGGEVLPADDKEYVQIEPPQHQQQKVEDPDAGPGLGRLQVGPQQETGEHGNSGGQQENVRGIHGGHFLLQHEIPHDPDYLIAEPEAPPGSLKHPENSKAPLAGEAIQSKCEKRGEHEQGTDDVADCDASESGRKNGTREYQHRGEKHSGTHPEF